MQRGTAGDDPTRIHSGKPAHSKTTDTTNKHQQKAKTTEQQQHPGSENWIYTTHLGTFED